jgi:hypothetical protein
MRLLLKRRARTLTSKSFQKACPQVKQVCNHRLDRQPHHYCPAQIYFQSSRKKVSGAQFLRFASSTQLNLVRFINDESALGSQLIPQLDKTICT